MTKGAALQQFFGRFMTAYASNAVPDDAVLPYLTYDAVFDAWGGGAVPRAKQCPMQRRLSFLTRWALAA